MLYVNTGNSHDPSLNLAAEEYVIRNIAPKDEILLFYINGPSIIIGRNQNTIRKSIQIMLKNIILSSAAAFGWWRGIS